MLCGEEWWIFFIIVWGLCHPENLMNILFLSQWFPFPPNNGSKIRIYNLLKGLSQFHNVTLFSFFDPMETSLNQKETYPFCSQVQLIPWRHFDAKSRKSIIGLFSLFPRSLVDTHSPEMEVLISEAVSSRKFDLIIASQVTMASYFPVFGELPAIFEEIELGHLLDLAYKSDDWWKRLRLRVTWFKLRRYFSRLLDSFQACTVVSEREKKLFVDSFPKFQDKVRVIPNSIDVDDYINVKKKDPNPNSIIFSGSFTYNVNYDAMCWFIREVFPHVLKQIPDANLIITGNHANKSLPSQKNVTLTGYIDDIKSLIASCSVSIAPILSGGGTRLKILEAMALGVPVVATSKGAEGLDAQNGEHLLIADDPDAFAKSVIKILEDKSFHDHLSSNAYFFVKKNYAYSTVMPQFINLVELGSRK